MNHYIKLVLSVIIILCNFGCDQITKEKARGGLSYNERVSIVEDAFILTKVENTGAALSLGEHLSPTLKLFFLQLFPILALLLLFCYVMMKKKLALTQIIAFSFIIGGGVGNIYDRVLHNSVTDFMYIEIGFLHTGIFNMADVSVVVGILLLMIAHMVSDTREKQLARTSV